MIRERPETISEEIDLYLRTYYSLLRSSGDVRVRAFEEAHLYGDLTLHLYASSPRPDVSAFGYCVARLPECMPRVQRIVLGQSIEQFESAGYDIRQWKATSTRGRRRPLRWDGGGNLAAFISSASDIDDLVPIVTAYQIEWNKLREALLRSLPKLAPQDATSDAEIARALDLGPEDMDRLRMTLGERWRDRLCDIRERECDLAIRLLNGSFVEYQRSAGHWWSAIRSELRSEDRQRPVYFVSSNTHSLANLLGGFARHHRDPLLEFAERTNPEGLWPAVQRAQSREDTEELDDLSYYLLRAYLHEPERAEERLEECLRFDAQGGIQSIPTPGRLDVHAQVIRLDEIHPGRLDPRVLLPGIERLRESRALIVNIDYPLGMAAYHHLSAVAEGVPDLRGVYVMGKAATLNGRVGDVMISGVVHDEHSKNTYLFPNCFRAEDVQPFLRSGSVLDSQKAVSVRSTMLQNRDYMSVFYREGYSVLEMEAGPYLSAVYEAVSPKRHPTDEIVNLSPLLRFEVGILHYASDTPYSRRQTLLSKSLSYFGVESTYGCTMAILRRIFAREIGVLENGRPS